MRVTQLSLTNFKNIVEARMEPAAKLNCLVGGNGMGKSNMLDALYYLSFCRSFTGVTDAAVVRHGEAFATLSGTYLRRGVEEEVRAGLTPGGRKSFRRKGKEYERLSSHIGSFPLVLSSPADQALVSGAGEERRRFMDMVISQSDPVYLDNLVRYGRLLQQRNRLLRDHVVDHHLYDALESAMSAAAAYITGARRGWVAQLQALFAPRYEAVGGGGEEPTLSYLSHLGPDDAGPEGLRRLMDQCRRRDEALGYTSVGPQRDDLELQLNGMPCRRVASQGQCKTFTVALRLAQYEFLAREAGLRPLLLLDDVFDRLDAARVERLMAAAASDVYGQIFVTDTNREHLDRILEHIPGDNALWLVDAGTVTRHTSPQP